MWSSNVAMMYLLKAEERLHENDSSWPPTLCSFAVGLLG